MSMMTGVAAATSDVEKMHEAWTGHDSQVLIVAVAGIAVVVALIVWLKMHPFLALTIGAIGVGLGTGIPVGKLASTFEEGVGSLLGNVGVLIVLGAMLGKLLADSGGADRVVDTLLRGKPATLPWKMAFIAAIIGLPMFFEIGLVLLVPVIMVAVRRAKTPAMRLGIPAMAGLSVLHGFVPPHPGPLAAIGLLNANLGITLALGLLVAIPTVVVAGPLFAPLAARWVPIGAAGAGAGVTGGTVSSDADHAGRSQDPDATKTPSFGLTLTTILTPVLLMLLRAAAEIWLGKDAGIYPLLQFLGEPIIAMLIAVLLAMVTMGTTVGFSPTTLTSKLGSSLMPIVGATMIVGAGGGFKQVLVDGGTAVAIGKFAVVASLSALLLGWIVAVMIRVATGSATVATITAAGIVAPLAGDLPPAQLSLVVLAIGAGSLFFSHVNDGGFWIVKEFFGMTVAETLKTWSVMETIISVMGLGLTLLLSLLL